MENQIKQEMYQELINDRCISITDYILSELKKCDSQDYRAQVSLPYVVGQLMAVLQNVQKEVNMIKFNNDKITELCKK